MGKTDFLPMKMKDFLYEFAKWDFIYMGGARNKNKIHKIILAQWRNL